MPLPVLAGAPIPPVTPPRPPKVSDRFSATWTAPDGTVWPLMDRKQGWHTLNAAVAFGAAPVQFTADPYSRGGSIVRHIQPQSRIITWPLMVVGADHPTWLARWRALMLAFTQTTRLGPGTLTISRPDGTQRQIQAYYQAGFDGGGGDLSGYRVDTAILSLFCPDPYWTGLDETTISRQFEGSPSSFFDTYPTISPSQILGDSIATNPGDVEAWPSWTINGPLSGITATNNLTGEAFTLDPNATGIDHGDLLLGETITITTNPPAVRGPGGAVWTGALNWPDAVLWALQPGDNDITIAATDSGTGTAIEMAFLPRYESA